MVLRSLAQMLSHVDTYRRVDWLASPWTRTTCGGARMSRNSLVWVKSACAEKEMASTDIRKGTCGA